MDHRDIALADSAIDHLRLEDQYYQALAEAVTYRWLFLSLFVEWGRQLDRANALEIRVRELMGVQ